MKMRDRFTGPVHCLPVHGARCPQARPRGSDRGNGDAGGGKSLLHQHLGRILMERTEGVAAGEAEPVIARFRRRCIVVPFVSL
ncbi:hypothetical protein [Paracoccus sp. MC1862]|uniref:hypothetical protein n=2 Tax=Paracoccus TaxID=265 RepID=UPI0016029B0E|nr:hypothetical protein [Paracoccus sp. MC1862]MBB1498440.1 hypothetical protein [Paracoccus sp. MC1862]